MGTRISDLPESTDLYEGCCIPIVTNGETKKLTYGFLKEKLNIDLTKVESISIAPTVTGAAGTNAKVENIGTETEPILKFTIPRGNKGNTGIPATVSVGTVTTGEAGSEAEVENVGTSSNAKFNFTIPKGDQGERGEKGEKGEDGANTVTVEDLLEQGVKVATLIVDGTEYNVLVPESGLAGVDLTQEEYDELEEAGEIQEAVDYYVETDEEYELNASQIAYGDTDVEAELDTLKSNFVWKHLGTFNGTNNCTLPDEFNEILFVPYLSNGSNDIFYQGQLPKHQLSDTAHTFYYGYQYSSSADRCCQVSISNKSIKMTHFYNGSSDSVASAKIDVYYR